MVTVLIAANDPTVRSVLSRTLSDAQTAVSVVADGYEAYKSITERTPDVVIEEVHMPGRNGLQLAESVRDVCPDLPFILITGLPVADLEHEADRLGISCVMLKPLHLPAIKEAVHILAGAQLCSDAPLPPCNRSASAAPQEDVTSGLTMPTHTSVVGRLQAAYPMLGADRAYDIVLDVLLRNSDAQSATDHHSDAYPSRNALSASSLYRHAWCKARDIIAADQARSQRELLWSKAHAEATHPEMTDIEQARFIRICSEIMEALPDDQSRIVFSLWLTGVRDTVIYAQALGMGSAEVIEQRRVVKSEKDRLLKYLRRSAAIRKAAAVLLQ